jgi:methionyl-tRNA formyltransferase
VALMRLEEGLDTGPVAAVSAVDIAPSDTAGELHDRLAVLGADLLMEHLGAILDGTARFTPQPADGATYAPKIAKTDALIDWREGAVALDRRIRAFNPWPVAETRLEGAQLRCWLARPLRAGGRTVAAPGTVVGSGADGIDVQTGDGILRLLSVQLAGRQRIAAGLFANGFAVDGKVLGA